MKYLWKATKDGNTIIHMSVFVLLTVIALWLNAKVLIWIQQALEHYNEPIKWLVLIVTEIVIVTIIDAYKNKTGASFAAVVLTNLMDMYVDKIANADYAFFQMYNPGVLSTYIGNCKPMSKIPWIIIDIIMQISKLIINISMIFIINPKIATVVLAIFIIGAIIMHKPMEKEYTLDQEFDKLKSGRNKEVDDFINGYSEVRSFAGLQQAHANMIKSHNAECKQIILDRNTQDAIISVIYNVVDGLGTMLILLYAIYAMTRGIITEASEAMTLVMFIWRLIDPSSILVSDISDLSEQYGPVPKFTEIMDYQNKVLNGSIELDKFENEISINNISFAYKDSNNVLEDVSFKIKKGMHIGICGSSGGGTSTLLKLIPRFYDVDSGSITIDGINIKNLDIQSFKKHIGIVNQDVFIFDGSISDNIRYGCVTREVTDAEVIEATKKVNLYDFIMSLPDKFNTNVGPRGLKLSGGQKQRLALARLFITNPDILILDEATSALDNETEKVIQDSLNAFSDKTMIVVAHRLSTIKNSDNIIVINNHKILEQGSHDELMKLDGEYAHLVKVAEKE